MSDIEENDSAIIAKLISGSCLFVVSVICGVIPFKLAKVFKWTEPIDPNSNQKNKSTAVVNILLCFGGGVLLATTFLHLLPDINHSIAWMEEDGLLPKMNLALGELLMMIGFFVIYLIEELVHNYLHRHQQKKEKEKKKLEDLGAFARGIDVRNSAMLKRTKYDQEKGDVEEPRTLQEEVSAHAHSHGAGHSHFVAPAEDEDMLVSNLRGLLIVLALSIHELFEGFAVGLEKTSAGVYFMFAAVAAHKFVISFCIGVELIVQKTQLWLAFVYIVVYSVVSALGIGIGAVLTLQSDNLQVPNIILQGLATGTLLYVIFYEVLSKDRSGLIPYLSICGGFALMFGLQYIAGITESQALENGKSFQHYPRYHSTQ